jgi:hypothetical protein
MARILRAPLALLLVVLSVAACGPRERGSDPEPRERTTLRGENRSWLDMTMYVVYTGTRQRLGQVSGNGTATFTIPASLVGFGNNLRFQADPIGSGNVAQSFDIFVRPGSEVTLTIPASVR